MTFLLPRELGPSNFEEFARFEIASRADLSNGWVVARSPPQ